MRKIVKDATLGHPRVALRPSVMSRPVPAARAASAHADPLPRPAAPTAEEDKQMRQLRQTAERAGYEAGIKQAQTDVLATLEAERARVNHLLGELRQAQAKQLQVLGEQCEAFAFTVLCRMLGDAAVTPAAVASAVKAVLREVGEGDVVLRVHPDDAGLMHVVLEGSTRPGLKIEADQGVRLGGCIAQTPAGSFDASFDTQLALLAQALSEARVRRDTKAGA